MLNVEQFREFMAVIKKLGDRVEREHGQFLRDSQRLEDRSAIPVSGAPSNPVGGEVNFENLVGRGDGTTVRPDTVIDGSSKGWGEDDVWDSIFSSDENVCIELVRVGSSVFIIFGYSRSPLRHCPLHRPRKHHPYHQLRWSHLTL